MTGPLPSAEVFIATSLGQARQILADWRRDYNENRPHSSIGRTPPARFAEQHRRHAADAVHQATAS